jgi:phospholipid/cholesterol/gamma-HCH transport system permease protein
LRTVCGLLMAGAVSELVFSKKPSPAVAYQDNVTASIGRPIVGFFDGVGELSLLLGRSVGAILSGQIPLGELVRQMAFIGVHSLPIVLITISFSGMVLALHTATQFHKLGGDQFIGGLVALSMARETAPVLTSVVVAARVGSAIAAELGTMKVTEQIDALRALAVSPIYYLVVPRLLAAILMMPIVTVFANVAGMVGGGIVSIYFTHISSGVFTTSIQTWLTWRDVLLGLVKTLVFGATIALVGCDRGLRTTGGAAGVGRATTSSVVLAIVLVLISDYFLSALMFGGS